MCLNDWIWTVGPPPNILIGGCYLVQRGMVIFFNFLILLFFELGQDYFAVCADAYSLNLNSRRNLDHKEHVPRLYVSTTFRTTVCLTYRTLVRSGTPLLRVIYRDSEFRFPRQDRILQTVPSDVAFFLILFSKGFICLQAQR